MSFNLKLALDGILLKTQYKVPHDYSQFAINQYLSKYKCNIGVLEQIICLKLTNEAHFKYLQKLIPYGYKSKLQLEEPKPEPIMQIVMKKYECSRRDAREIIKYLSQEEQDDLLQYYEELTNG